MSCFALSICHVQLTPQWYDLYRFALSLGLTLFPAAVTKVKDADYCTHSVGYILIPPACSLSYLTYPDHGIYALRETHIVHFPRYSQLKSVATNFKEEVMGNYPLSSTLAAFFFNARQTTAHLHGNVYAKDSFPKTAK